MRVQYRRNRARFHPATVPALTMTRRLAHAGHDSRSATQSSIDVFQRWARALFLQRRHLLPQSEVFNYAVGSAPTHRPQRTGAESDEKDEYAEHGGGV